MTIKTERVKKLERPFRNILSFSGPAISPPAPRCFHFNSLQWNVLMFRSGRLSLAGAELTGSGSQIVSSHFLTPWWRRFGSNLISGVKSINHFVAPSVDWNIELSRQRTIELFNSGDRISTCGGVVWCGVVWCGVVWCGVVGGEAGSAPTDLDQVTYCYGWGAGRAHPRRSGSMFGRHFY